jgi:hypothetical protein
MAVFEGWIRLQEARRALERQAWEEALHLASDPKIRDHQRAKSIRAVAVQGILDRARRARERNDLSQAYRDVKLVLERRNDAGAIADAGTSGDEATALEKQVRSEIGRREGLRGFHDQVLAEARRDADEGLLVQARSKLELIAAEHPEAKLLLVRVALRMDEADAFAEQAARAASENRLDAAREALQRAKERFSHHAAIAEVERQIGDREHASRVERVRGLLAAGRAEEALGAARGFLPAEHEATMAARAALERLAVTRLREALDVGDLGEAEAQIRRAREADLRGADLEALVRATRLWKAARERADAGDLAGGVAVLDQVRGCLGEVAAIERERGGLESRAGECDRLLDEALERVRAGALSDARSRLLEVLRIAPGHRAAKDQLAGVELFLQSEADGLDRARAALETGKLGEARVLFTRLLGSSSRETAEAGIRAVDERSARAEAIVNEAEGTAAAARTASRDELARALERAREALRLDADSASARLLRERLEREITVRDRIDWGAAKEVEGDVEAAYRWYGEGLALDPSHSVCTRERARVAGQLAKTKLDRVEDLLRQRRFASAAGAARAVQPLVTEVAGADAAVLEARIRAVNERVAAETDAVRPFLEAAERGIREGDLRAARAALDLLEARFVDQPDLARLRSSLEREEGVERTIGDVERHLERRETTQAREKLAALSGATPPAVRDLRSRASRGADLSPSFVIRVEEGSEYLVLTADRLAIGNVLSGGNDLALFGAVSSRHAELRRTVSFHRGVEYAIVSAPGKDVFVGAERVSERVLRDGDVVRLGDSVKLQFRVPCPKSRSAVLLLRGATAVDGIERVLLFWTGGREGRLVLGPGKASHVVIPSAEREIEIHGTGEPGVIECRSAIGVSVDDAPEAPEAPIRRGASIRSGAVRFHVE